MRSFLEGGGYMHMTNHQTQDFYAHSNYVEVMKENGYTDENMVTFDQLDPKSEIFSKVMSTLRTEVYKDDGSVKNGHDGKLHGGQDKFVSDPKSVPTGSDDFMAKDANGADGKTLLSDGTYGGFKHPNHDGAVRLATDATERKLAGTTVNNAQGTNTQCADECQ